VQIHAGWGKISGMKLNITHADIWAASLQDRPAGLAKKLEALQKAGANLEFIMARRAVEEPGTGVVFLAPLNGAKQTKAASVAGFHQTEALHSVRIEGADAPGLAAKITRCVAGAGINLRGFSASVIGKRFVAYLALDDEDDAVKAARVLKGL
jgi:hypothetical protein